MDDIEVPLYYILGNKLSEEALEHAQQILSITPCFYSVIYKGSDLNLAQSLTQDVLHEGTEDSVRTLAITTGHPVLIINDGAELIAVYEDFRREQCLSKIVTS